MSNLSINYCGEKFNRNERKEDANVRKAVTDSNKSIVLFVPSLRAAGFAVKKQHRK